MLCNSILRNIALVAMAFFTLQHSQAQIRINELLAVNSTIAHDPDFGGFSDFVELRNTAASPVNLSGYTLTDDPGEADKWALPALILAPGELLLVWTDGLNKYPGDTAFVACKNTVATMTALHAGFRLSGDGEYLGLFDPQGNPADEVMYCTQANDVSYGRNPATPSSWFYFGEPTPGKPNSPYGSEIMEVPGEPVFSLPEGFYPTPQMLHLGTQEPGAVIRFTFDGTTPNGDSPFLRTVFP
ncbi:MAG: lamin tail domain-containing protein [Lewinellaceae bacterium]|nr:lamin tail domain-containing protein [Lewinellaceae bacterium]